MATERTTEVDITGKQTGILHLSAEQALILALIKIGPILRGENRLDTISNFSSFYPGRVFIGVYPVPVETYEVFENKLLKIFGSQPDLAIPKFYSPGQSVWDRFTTTLPDILLIRYIDYAERAFPGDGRRPAHDFSNIWNLRLDIVNKQVPDYVPQPGFLRRALNQILGLDEGSEYGD